MIFFAAYALLVWTYVARWRRTWIALAYLAAGLAVLGLVAYLHLCLNDWTHGRIYLRVLQTILYPYILMVGVVGIYIACLPRRPVESECIACQYSLEGLGQGLVVCPECGLEQDPLSPARAARSSRAAARPPEGPRWPANAEPEAIPARADG